MSEPPKKPSVRPTVLEPPRTKSGEMGAVKAYRAKLESIADGTFEKVVSLNDDIAAYVEQLRGNTTPPPVRPAPEEEPMSEDDIVGWDDVRDQPIRRRDLAESVHTALDLTSFGPEADTRRKLHVGFPSDEPTTRPEQANAVVPDKPALVYQGTGFAALPRAPRPPPKR